MPSTSSLRQPLNLMWAKIICFYDVTYNVILFWLNYVVLKFQSTLKIPKEKLHFKYQDNVLKYGTLDTTYTQLSQGGYHT